MRYRIGALAASVIVLNVIVWSRFGEFVEEAWSRRDLT